MKKEPIMGKIVLNELRCIVEHLDTGSLMFLPGSQNDKPLKDISHLMNEPQKFALIKLDRLEEMLVYQEEK